MEPQKHKIIKKFKLAGLASLMLLGLLNMVLLFSGVFMDVEQSASNKLWPSIYQTVNSVDSTGGEDSLAGFKSTPENGKSVDSTKEQLPHSETSSDVDADEENGLSLSDFSTENIQNLYQGFTATVVVAHEVYSYWNFI